MKRRFFTMMLAAALLFLYACQPTPDTGYVQQKQGDLTEKIEETAKAGQAPTGVGSHYTLEKTYAESGKTLVVDADITGGDESQMAVLTVAPRYFESGDSLRQMTEGLFPGYEIYRFGGETKADLRTQIEEAELLLFRLENHLSIITGEPLEEGEVENAHPQLPESMQIPMDEYEKLYGDSESDDITLAKMNLEELKQKYAKAPDSDAAFGPPDYTLRPAETGEEAAAVRCVKGNMRYFISFSNQDDGNTSAVLWIDRVNDYSEIGGKMEDELPAQATRAAALEDTAELEKIQGLLRAAGIDYMELYEFRKGGSCGEYVFTRSYNGAVEDYAAQYLNLKSTDGDGAVAQRLWEPESFTVEMYEGEIYTIRWYNPSKIIKVDNENTKILSWQEIQTVFERQMGYMLTPGEEQQGWWDPDEVRVERISLELGKVLMKDSGEYKLIPVWNFFGRDDSIGKIEDAEEKCYLSVNALDGTVIDRNLMY